MAATMEEDVDFSAGDDDNDDVDAFSVSPSPIRHRSISPPIASPEVSARRAPSRSPQRIRHRSASPPTANLEVSVRSAPSRSPRRAPVLAKARGSVAGLLGISRVERREGRPCMPRALLHSSEPPQPLKPMPGTSEPSQPPKSAAAPPPFKACPGLRKRPRQPSPAASAVQVTPAPQPVQELLAASTDKASASSQRVDAARPQGQLSPAFQQHPAQAMPPLFRDEQPRVAPLEQVHETSGASGVQQTQLLQPTVEVRPDKASASSRPPAEAVVCHGEATSGSSMAECPRPEASRLKAAPKHSVDLSESSDEEVPAALPSSPASPASEPRPSAPDSPIAAAAPPSEAAEELSATVATEAPLASISLGRELEQSAVTAVPVASCSDTQLSERPATTVCPLRCAASDANGDAVDESVGQVVSGGPEERGAAEAENLAPRISDPLVAMAQEEESDDDCMILEVTLPSAPLRIPTAEEVADAARQEEMRRIVSLEAITSTDDDDRQRTRAARFGIPAGTASSASARRAGEVAPLRRPFVADGKDSAPLPEVIFFRDRVPLKPRAMRRPPPPRGSMSADLPKAASTAPDSGPVRPKAKKMPRVESRPAQADLAAGLSRGSSVRKGPPEAAEREFPGIFPAPPSAPATARQFQASPDIASVPQWLQRGSKQHLTMPEVQLKVPVARAGSVVTPRKVVVGSQRLVEAGSSGRVRTGVCRNWERNRRCGYGVKCKFLHDGHAGPIKPIERRALRPQLDPTELDPTAAAAMLFQRGTVGTASLPTPPWRRPQSPDEEVAEEVEACTEMVDNTVDDSRPGAYIDSALLEEAEEDVAEALEELSEEAEEEQEEADLQGADVGLEDDALEDEAIQAILLKDAGMPEIVAGLDPEYQALEAGHPGGALETVEAVAAHGEEGQVLSEDEAFLDNIYEG